ncbi:LacI family DNA-binding transcriptional regulator [uncultured Friedmanniella sp.]|uniref:LacI family DNA-binding transcriptional regulator n=1 Tax=uncultured Friedmanniella sp. TaxID=335381 RepID=UPI0035CAD6F3
MARKATAQDVADLAGVSRSAVSLVLNGRASGHISLEKQKAVFAAAAQLSYTPNAVAISLRSQRTRTIGVLTWSSHAALPDPILRAARLRAHEDQYLLLLMDTGGDADRGQRQLETLRDRQVDGFLVVAPDITHYEPSELLLSLPTVLLNCVDPEGGLTSVVADEVEVGRCGAEVLLEQGHRRVGLLTGSLGDLHVALRVRGVGQAFVGAGLSPPTPVVAGRQIDDGYRAASQVLGEPDRPTAFICTAERLAVGAVLAAAELGVPVPDALSLVSLEDAEGLAPTLVPPLTSVHRPYAAMAQEAVAQLVARLADPVPAEVRQLLFHCQVHHRSSVAPPGEAGGRPASR